jgi:GNAT superfamily N-acetyltransferase
MVHYGVMTFDASGQVDLEFQRLFYDDPTVQMLVRAMAEDLAPLYGPRDYPAQDPAKWTAPDGTMLIVTVNGEPVGCGGLVRHGEKTAEVKRMFVQPGYRGRGIARRLLEALVQEAELLGYDELVLETGTRQLAAQALYRAEGFHVIACWPPHDADATSVCYALSLRHQGDHSFLR